MQILKIGTVAFTAQTRVTLGRLDLDHVGAPVGELAYTGRPGAHPRQIDDFETSERTRTGHEASIADNLATRRGKSGSAENHAEKYASIGSLASHD